MPLRNSATDSHSATAEEAWDAEIETLDFPVCFWCCVKGGVPWRLMVGFSRWSEKWGDPTPDPDGGRVGEAIR